jgi:MYXO-CTERM domain-containing protein
MRRILPVIGGLVLAVSGFAQSPETGTIPSPYTDGRRTNGYTDTRPVERASGNNWGLLGLLGLAGLLGARRRDTIVDRGTTYTSEQRHRAA